MANLTSGASFPLFVGQGRFPRLGGRADTASTARLRRERGRWKRMRKAVRCPMPECVSPCMHCACMPASIYVPVVPLGKFPGFFVVVGCLLLLLLLSLPHGQKKRDPSFWGCPGGPATRHRRSRIPHPARPSQTPAPKGGEERGGGGAEFETLFIALATVSTACRLLLWGATTRRQDGYLTRCSVVQVH